VPLDGRLINPLSLVLSFTEKVEAAVLFDQLVAGRDI
jgi:hypothetical protein